MAEAVFKLFVSSPGDVAAERARADAVVEKLNAEFKDRARFEPAFWEDHFYSADKTFQDQIPEAADCDLVIAIFKARLGSPLPAGFKRQPDGEPYPSGTAYEVLSAIAKRRDGAPIPDIYVFRYPRDPKVSLDDPKRPEIETQWRVLKDFFERWFKTSSGEFLAGFQTYDSTDDFAEQVENCLRQWLAKRGVVAREVWDRARVGSPFPGLAAFESDRTHVFFGRDLAIRQAGERLRQAKTPFLLILGASGAGKSSILRAGLMPKLMLPGAIPEVDLMRPVVMTPGLDPFAELAEALLKPEALGGKLAGGRFADRTTLAEALRGDPSTAVGLISEALDRAAEARRAAAHYDKPRPTRLLLGVDQAERLFTEATKDADAFGGLIQALAGPAAYVVMVLRADAYARLQACAPLLALRAVGAIFDLMPPTPAELADIVARPVAACEPPLDFGPSDPPLAERLVADAKGGDALPLLQMTLEGLYKAEETRGDGVLRAEDFKGMAAAVTEAANAAVAPLGDEGRKALEALVAGLVADLAPDPVTGEPAPVVVALDRDAFVKGKPDREALVSAFVEARLLTIEGAARVRPTHDALLRIWPEAAALVKEMGPLIRARRALAPLAQAWAEAAPGDKAKHLEMSAPLLAAGQQLEARFGDDLGAPLQPFIAEAEKAEAAERAQAARRRRNIFGATLAALAVMTSLAGAAVWQWRDAVAQKAAAVEAKNDADAQKTIALDAKNEAIAQKAAANQAKNEALAQKAAAERDLALATDAADSLVFDLAQKFRDVSGVPVSLIKSLLDRAGDLQEKLLGGGQSSPGLLRSQAAALDETSVTLLTIGDTKGALDAAQKSAGVFEMLLKQDPDSPDYQRDLSVSYEKIGDVKRAQGDLAGALIAYQDSLAIAERLAKSDLGNAGWQRDLSVSYEKIGDVKRAQGDLAGALIAYQDSLAIRDRLAKSDPGNTGWQRDLSVSLNKVGEVNTAEGDLAGALKAYQDGLVIIDRLAKSDPGNAGWQRDLSVSYERIGDVKTAQGDLAGALKAYQDGLVIVDRLAKSDLGNAGWQRDLSVSWSNIGEVKTAQGDLAGALEAYQDDLAIAARLAKSDPGNARWQRDLSVSLNKLGDVKTAQGDLAGALKAYQDSLAIRDRLAKSDPGNAEWQRDLAVSWSNIGEVKTAQDDLAGALKAYQDSLAIFDRLAKSEPGDAGWQRDLAVSWSNIGEVKTAQGDFAGALRAYQDCFAISDRLAKSDPGNAGWQRDLAVSLNNIGDVKTAQGDLAGALKAYQDCFAISDRLAKSDPGDAEWQRDLAVSDSNLASVYLAQKDSAKARGALNAGRAIMAKLVALSPDNAGWKEDLARFDQQLAALKR